MDILDLSELFLPLCIYFHTLEFQLNFRTFIFLGHSGYSTT